MAKVAVMIVLIVFFTWTLIFIIKSWPARRHSVMSGDEYTLSSPPFFGVFLVVAVHEVTRAVALLIIIIIMIKTNSTFLMFWTFFFNSQTPVSDSRRWFFCVGMARRQAS